MVRSPRSHGWAQEPRSQPGARTTIAFDIPFGYAAGAAIAMTARRALLRAHDPMHTRYFGVAAIFGGVALAPAGIALYAMFPDWSLMYLANPAHLPGGVMIPLLFVLYAAAPLAGFTVTHRFLLAHRAPYLRASLLAPIVWMVATMVLGAHRFLTVAYYDAYHANLEQVSLFESPLLVSLGLASIAVAGALVFSIASVRKHADDLDTSLAEAGSG